jgi:signal transduction histidine kinase
MALKKVAALLLYLVGLQCPSNSLVAQTLRLDSLKKLVYSAPATAPQEIILLSICEQYFSLSADSLAKYVALGLKTSPPNSDNYFRFKNYYCFYYLKNGEQKKALQYLDSLLETYPNKSNNNPVRLEIIYHKAVSCNRNSKYKEAIELALQYLDGVENRKDTLSMLRAYSVLGWSNMELEDEKEALRWLRRGLTLTTNQTLIKQMSSLHLNAASCYNITDINDSAWTTINIGLQFAQEVENLTNQANALNIRASILSKNKKYAQALADLEKGLSIRQKIGDLHYIVSDMGQLAHFYAYVNQPQKGIAIAKEGITLAEKANNTYKLLYLKKGMAKNLQLAGRNQECIETLYQIVKIKDSLYEHNTAEEIGDLQAKYELQKKENIIIQQESKLVRNRYITLAAVLVFLLASFVTWLLYRSYQIRQKRKMEQALANERVNSIKAVQQAEEKERKRIAADLHDNLGSYAAAITSNIRFLRTDNHALPNDIISNLEENAEGIVTQLSDTIWILKNEELPITKLADRFKAWTQKIIRNYPNVTYYYNEEIDEDVELTPGSILNVFLILKETLNNALKHSGCSEIHISIVSKEYIHFSIEDNGIGIQANQEKGNGIDNMKLRARESGFHLVWKPVQPTGTRVELFNRTSN